jgi:citrate synthase
VVTACPTSPWWPGDGRVTEFLTAAQAAQRLGVKPATLYAYVSRGVLRRARAGDGRGSLFDSEEVERLARRGRPRRPAGVADITVESAITELTADSLRFRGHDATRLAVTRSFEEVAELLWTGEFPPAQPAPPPHAVPPVRAVAPAAWHATPAALATGRAAQAALPAGTLPLERLQVIVPAMAATDSLRLQLDRPAVLAAARNLIAGMVDCLPAPSSSGTGPADQTSATSSAPSGSSAPIAERLWSMLCDRRPAPELLRALSAALVLLADHELAASTLAARAAASVRADPYAVVGTGLGAMSGVLHGGASLGVETLIAAARGPQDVPRVVGELVRRAAPKSGQLAVAEAVLAEVRRKSLPGPNIDFAVATLARVAGMVPGAGEAVFAVARTAGWIAHALEAYAGGGPLRPRAVYTGPPAIIDP